MERVEEFRNNAAEAERRAVSALSPDERDQYRQIALGWRELAEGIEKRKY